MLAARAGAADVVEAGAKSDQSLPQAAEARIGYFVQQFSHALVVVNDYNVDLVLSRGSCVAKVIRVASMSLLRASEIRPRATIESSSPVPIDPLAGADGATLLGDFRGLLSPGQVPSAHQGFGRRAANPDVGIPAAL
jgi:hypothetical protein